MGEPVTPGHSKHPLKTPDVEGFKETNLPAVESPGLAAIQQSRQHDSTIDLNLGFELDVVIAEDPAANTPKRRGGRAQPAVKLRSQ